MLRWVLFRGWFFCFIFWYVTYMFYPIESHSIGVVPESTEVSQKISCIVTQPASSLFQHNQSFQSGCYPISRILFQSPAQVFIIYHNSRFSSNFSRAVFLDNHVTFMLTTALTNQSPSPTVKFKCTMKLQQRYPFFEPEIGVVDIRIKCKKLVYFLKIEYLVFFLIIKYD